MVGLPDEGETFSAEVDRISGSGNGVIEIGDGHINIGPISEEAVGEVVEVKKIDDLFGICLADEFKPDDYESKFQRVRSSGPQKSGSSAHKNKSIRSKDPSKVWNSASGDAFPEKAREAQKNKSPVVSSPEEKEISFTGSVKFCVECGSTMLIEGNTWVCKDCSRKIEKTE